MSETYTRLIPVLDAVGRLPAALTLPFAVPLYVAGRRYLKHGRAYEAFFFIDAALRTSGHRMLAARLDFVRVLVEVGQLDDALAMKRWVDRSIDKQAWISAESKKYLRCYLNGLLPLHWHSIRQQPGEAVDPFSIDFRGVSHLFTVTLEINPKLFERFDPCTKVAGRDRNGIPIIVHRRTGGVPGVQLLSR
jgi:hypothetical protein